MGTIKIKRVYLPADAKDGLRVLVDRLWPRGLTKIAAAVDLWAKELSPSNELRKWYQHDPKKWAEFQKRYTAEIRDRKDALAHLRQAAKTGAVTLLFGSREEKLNNAAALKKMLDG